MSTADKFLKVASVSSGTTGIGQLSFADAGGGKVLQLVVQQQMDTTPYQGKQVSHYCILSGLSMFNYTKCNIM